ncbi:DUF4430 domain-containing protein [Oceanobacillus salinisoli]|uniref:DUF4430 domain-containing protein n=1 Tax=Oceanobacillus salinisoli TaxID=2678611 RepID=UPI0012E15171|nr:DUF4430 domain-containing protein [Oceanobacillus salinisoli]
MKMWKIPLMTLLLLMGVLAGCASEESDETENNASTSTTNSSQTEEVAEDHVRITISVDNGAEFITEEEIPIEEGDILLDVMEEHFYVEHEGGFITSIERVEASEEEQTAWMYFVNDEMPTVGAAEYELSSGDKIVFDLQSWE